ncbi:hypothetical protein LPJ64_004018 [Coemansia asiatica]|uniref:Dopey N-terminal domain-containing protein n=1 Tax=Coemansia asiatica TaxID=1052880 RepID=A0A9W7XGX1_9FUNG|nr:hypothetical protein LPJ64_004018 [Coemansia asiatica]
MSDMTLKNKEKRASLSSESKEEQPTDNSTQNEKSKRANPLLSSSFETDLSSPRRRRFEDRSKAYQSDPKYQKYVQLVERNLQSFDYVSEWADVTAFLTKLGRSFEIYSKFAVVPHKETVAKRLAQCLNPALPTGVHQKVLGIYEQIFRQIGSNQLVADLQLYAYGLFPFMRNASLKSKPQLLDIFEEFFIPLGPSLRPCMKSFAAGLLPGLEEGSVDLFNRVMQLLDKLKDTVDAAFFFQTMFLIMITNSKQRESALKYLAQRLPVFTSEDDIAAVCGEDSSLMARALAATLTDSKSLVLRAALDLIMIRFPLRTNVFEIRDLTLLLKHAAEVVLKKDMSLNRRLYTWLLGPSETDAEQILYFSQYAQKHLTEALLGSFAAMGSDPDRQHTVVRVLIGLMDKPLISQPVLDSMFVPLLQLLISEREARGSERVLPVKLASISRMLVEMLDPMFTWSSVISQLTDLIGNDSESLDVGCVAKALQLVLFFVQTFELDDESSLQVHIPMVLISVLSSVERALAQQKIQKQMHLVCCFTRLAIELLTRIPKSVFIDDSEVAEETAADGCARIVATLDVSALFGTTRSFYRINRIDQERSSSGDSIEQVERSAAEVVRGSGLLYSIIRLCKNISAHLSLFIVHVATSQKDTSKTEKLAVLATEDICHVMKQAVTYSRDFMELPELSRCTLPLPEPAPYGQYQIAHPDLWVPAFISVVCQANDFGALKISLLTLLQFVECGALQKSVFLENDTLANFVQRLWSSLTPDRAAENFQATQLLYMLRNTVDAQVVERLLASKLANLDSSYSRELSRYSVFWHNMRFTQRKYEYGSENGIFDPLAFSRLLLLVLDGAISSADLGLTVDEGDGYGATSVLTQQTASQAWIDASAGDWEYILQTLLILLLVSIRTQKRIYSTVLAVGYASECQEYSSEFDYPRIAYYLDTIQRYLLCAGDDVILSMLSTKPSSSIITKACESFSFAGASWMQVLVSTAAEFALTDAPNCTETDSSAVDSMRAKATSLASYLVSRSLVLWPVSFISKLQTRVIDALLFCVLYHRISIQPPLLDLFSALVCAKVNLDPGQTVTVPASAATAAAAPAMAGVSAIADLTLFSRLVLAALTMQLSIVALSKWVKTIRLCLPSIQDHISSGGVSVSEDRDLMRSLALPCLHSLRLLLSQCSEYFAKANDLQFAATRRRVTRRQLQRRLVPLFAIPSEAHAGDCENENGIDNDDGSSCMSIDALAVLLDAFDLFLSLCLRNADHLVSAEAAAAAGASVNRPSSRASSNSVQSNFSSSGSGAMGPIPILKFVSNIFGQDEASLSDAAADGDAAQSAERDDAESLTRASKDDETDSLGFSLVTVLSVMRELWMAFGGPPQPPKADTAITESQMLLSDFGVSSLTLNENSEDHVKHAIHSQITKILEHAVSTQPAEVTEAMVALWISDNPQWITHLDTTARNGSAHSRTRRRQSSASSMHSGKSPSTISRELVTSSAVSVLEEAPLETVDWSWSASDLLETVSGRSTVSILTTLLNGLHIRSIDPVSGAMQSSASGNTLSASSADSPVSTRFSNIDDIAVIRFIELYTRHQLTARLSSVLVPHVVSLLRDYNNNAQQHKLILPFLLRMFTELCERVASNSTQTQSQGPSHRVYSQELCATYARLVDNCILIAGRSFDQTTWLRRANLDSAGGAGGLVIRTGLRSGSSNDCVLSEDDLIDQILSFISSCVIPQFALLVPDYELQVSIATNLMHYAVVPAFKSHMTGGYSGPAQAITSRSQHFSLVLRCLAALSQQASLMKVWKREVWEFFCDSKFFPESTTSQHTTMTPALAQLWRHLVRTLLTSEKERFAEVLGKISSASSGPALFANREHEAQMRAISLRRLSFVVWAGATNQYLTSLPQIQERLVDILKNSPHPVVQMEVFLCLRVLLCRMSNNHMSSFWPMLLTELMRLCNQQLAREGREDPEQANLFMAACKFLDLLFVLGSDEFLVHQWIFITDTIDALYGSRSVSSALLDQLSSRLLSIPSKTSRRHNLHHSGDHANVAGHRNAATESSLEDIETYPKALLSDSADPTNLVYQHISSAAAELAKSGAIGLISSSDLQTLSGHPLKRPIIRSRSVASIRDLDAFVHNASLQTYQAAYTMAEPDIEFIEALLVSDLMYFDFASPAAATNSAFASSPLNNEGDSRADF